MDSRTCTPGRAIGPACALILLLLLLGASPARALTLPAGFEDETIAAGFTSPVAAAPAPDGRIFVAEKRGVVRIVNANGTVQPGPLLDISNQVNNYQDRGLLGIAVDKDFATNGYLYLLYTYEVAPLTPDLSGRMVARLTRVTVSSQNTASPETVLIGSYSSGVCPSPSNTLDCIPSDGISHSIGTIRVDPSNGTLWVGAGDAASFNQVDQSALRTYDETSLSGKILHVDRNGRGLPGHPFCPSDADLSHVCTKLYAKGFRNPYRFHLRPDRPPVVGDVGWNTSEELDVVKAGQNHGWPCWEANSQTPGYRDLQACKDLYPADGDTKPLYSYSHSGGSAAVVGGPEYNGTDWPTAYRSSIYVGDYAKGFIRRVRVDADDKCLDLDAQGKCVAQPFATDWFGGVDLQAAPGGGLLHVAFGDGGPNGALKRITYSGANKRPVADASASPLSGPVPLPVQFSSSGSSDPDGSPLSYQWSFGDGSASSTSANPGHTYTAKGSYTATLTVSDGDLTATDTVEVAAGGTPPVAAISAPANDSTYRAGNTIQLRGSGTDAEDGQLSGSRLEWRVVLVHDQHDHPLTTLTGTQAAFTASADHDADSHYEITLTATDSSGLRDQKTITIRPQTVKYELRSAPEAGVPVSYAGIAGATTMTRNAAVGFRTTISADETFTKLGRSYLFDRWSDGGARLHNVTIPGADTAITATYREDKSANRPATASTSQTGFPPELANDVRSSTRWGSNFADGQWWRVDLGSVRKVDTVEVNWEAAFASRYKIQTSTDGTTFSDAADVSISGKRVERTAFTARDARYVRILGVTRGTQWGISFWDVRVLGPEDAAPPAEEDKARGRPATASTTQSGFLPALANDGDSNTRWSSGSLDSQWWQVDLGSVRKVDAVELNWERAYAKRYKVLTSTDGTNFTEAADVTIADPGLKRMAFGARDARYVRILGVTRATAWGISLWDARVYGPQDDKARGRPATASTSEGGLGPAKGNDGDSSTRWGSNFVDGQWWRVDLGSVRKVDTVEVNWEAAFASRYKVQTSTDGTTFSDAADVSITGKRVERTSFSARDARYVRVLGVTRGTQWGISFWDARVFGPAE